MTYFKGPEDAGNPSLAYGSFSLENATYGVKGGHRFSFCFTIATTGGRVYTLVAKDQEDMDRWQRATNVRGLLPAPRHGPSPADTTPRSWMHAQYVIQQANADAALLKAREKDAGANVIPRGRAPVGGEAKRKGPTRVSATDRVQRTAWDPGGAGDAPARGAPDPAGVGGRSRQAAQRLLWVADEGLPRAPGPPHCDHQLEDALVCPQRTFWRAP